MQIFLKHDTENVDQKEKIDKWDNVKVKNLYLSKGTIKGVKRQVTEWKKIFIGQVPFKEFISRIYIYKRIGNTIEK